MTYPEKAQSPLILAAVLVGLMVSNAFGAARWAGHIVLPALILMLTLVFLQIPLRGFADVFRYREIAIASLLINFLWTPLFAWALGWLFLGEQPALWIGFLMLMVTPCTDWYLVFTGIARGNLPLSTALLPINLILQLLLLPGYILLLAGAVVPVQWSALLESVAVVLLTPLVTAILLRRTLVRRRSELWVSQKLLPYLQPMQLFLLALAIAAMFAAEGNAILQNPRLLLYLLPPLALFWGGNLMLAVAVGKMLNSRYADLASLSFTTLARNSPIALAIALSAFPEEPLVALALVIGPLIELPALALIAQTLLWIERRGWFAASAIHRLSTDIDA
ncbi:MAG: arsenic resistance protein [Caldilinea sp.]|nr:arsenic resistance protein [Caldilinea sp.]MDW8440701.1 arsenic resistance protein [Caldilineaceae bacterium]